MRRGKRSRDARAAAGFGHGLGDEELSRLRSAIDSIDEGFQVIGFDWRYLYVNAAVARHGRRSREELVGRTMMECYPGVEQTEMFRTLARCMTDRQPATIENEFVYPDGKRAWFELRIWPSPEGISVLSVDITERKRAAEDLRAREAHYRTILENVADGVFITDLEGRYLDVNPRACELTGYTREELLGLRSADTYLPEDKGQAAIRLRDIVAEGRGVFERRLRRKDGSILTAEINARALPDGRLLATMRDATERRQLEQQLRQAQKMEAVGRLAGGVAHDFNNVLTAIFGYADLVAEELPETSAGRQDIAEIRKAAQRASALTRQLLAFSRQQVLEPVVLNLKDLVHDIDRMLAQLIGEDIRIRVTLAPHLGNVRADPGQLQQVLMNLVVNARDAMPRGGKLLIEAANADLTEQYADRHQPVVPGAYILLAVSDTGVGMNAQTTARIFEPFFTTKEQGKGTGLGLSTVYGIVKQSGGYIWVYSEPGRGTTFKIYLPRVDAPVEEGARTPELAGTVAGTETILLAEDDELLRPLAKGVLEKLGYTVLEAASAEDALARAREYRGPIHLLVSDVVMPGESGSQLARRLVELRPDTRVLYMSGYTDDAIVHHGMLERGINYLQKPFTPAVLARRVRDVLDAPAVDVEHPPGDISRPS